eukprot:GHVT01061919.1.p1 GENE.GHVT01061919.1~~GHVT01061919.1.p1  ORF type:complete len:219 (-),score=23.48 GHVT01061919.1:1615-2271(-)
MEDDGHVKDLEMHLTNVAVQRHSGKFDKTVGGKWPLSRMKPFFLSRFGTARTRAALAQIERAVVGSLLSVQKTLINDKHCFELYGYDFLLDDEFRPWLLEVNGSPSLTANTPSDYSLKFKMLMDVLDVVDLEQRYGRRRSSTAESYSSSLMATFGQTAYDTLALRTRRSNEVVRTACVHTLRDNRSRLQLSPGTRPSNTLYLTWVELVQYRSGGATAC